ncbi:hypothetical protein ND748_14705 [Frankia sp. AiPs1]|uniref:phosphatase domain-containing protein n=1 Tax=Frankia sp. AiPs1 TaxID=573493 RepID=UPI002042DBAD|nr:protein-tyrosine phosphatase family protein [Frankia sp. AiPs1]MCM3922906.1 hypothetical protein [Frankia sp. AiPs1]
MTAIAPGGTPSVPGTTGALGTDTASVVAAPGTARPATIRRSEPTTTTSEGAGAPPGGADVPPVHPTDGGPGSPAAASAARTSSGPIPSADAAARPDERSADEGSAEPPAATDLPTVVPLPGAIRLPDGGWIRPRGLRHPPAPGPLPDCGLYLGGARLRRRHDGHLAWPHEWIDWPDFLLPRNPTTAAARIRALHAHTQTSDRIELACGGGVGRTGTVLACLAVLAGLSPADAVTWTRAHHHPRAVETPWQRRWIQRFPTL